MAAIDWDSLDTIKYRDEAQAVRALLDVAPLDKAERAHVVKQAISLVNAARKSRRKQGVVESFLQQFSLGTKEGLALMCLAEALLRTPDAETRDRLIAEKIGSADWARHLGASDSMFVNASTWGLMLTGRLVDIDDEQRDDPVGWFMRLAGRIGEPVIRQAVTTAVKIMGEQFVLGRTIEAALARAKREDMLCSFDMLGEGARTADDAERYERIYADAIKAVGKAAKGDGPELGHGISVKLSALCPRYEAVQEARVWAELYPRMLRLAEIAAQHDLNFAIDAEEADRLVLSLKLFEKLAHEPSLAGWTGLGIVVQAYQKRGLAVLGMLQQLAKDSGRRIMVRLVKGAYWDSEVKRAQVAGRPDYPVFTTKAATDLSYLACARALIGAAPDLYPQFATHNAHTLVAVRHLAAEAGVTIEHQRLHGMGEALYEAAEDRYGQLRLRAYAPVGGHEELLPYLVRRLLENGANSSFVHQLADPKIDVDALLASPLVPAAQPGIAAPIALYGWDGRHGRANSRGADLACIAEREPLQRAIATTRVASVATADEEAIAATMARLHSGFARWNATPLADRAAALRRAADALEARLPEFCGLLVHEGRKTLGDCVAEVREAVDFCRYYAEQAQLRLAPQTLPGPTGESNELHLHGRGVFVCISPWNFPLAIFAGQVVAALVAGNSVAAKPAEQTPAVARLFVALLHEAGVPDDALALLHGPGETVGAALVADTRTAGVCFTGSTAVAKLINRTLAAKEGPIVPLIAETGGINAMLVDSTALPEQVVDAVVQSAFRSAGQRCSALRLLCVHESIADGVIEMIRGALRELDVGDPALLATDVGPLIDAEAFDGIRGQVERLKAEASLIGEAPLRSNVARLLAPVAFELKSIADVKREIFGPVLHVVRWGGDPLAVVAQVNALGYGLTFGIQTRIDSRALRLADAARIGNVYVNRNMIGAVVGVQPFGGEGLSGTGPKAGGPHYLYRFCSEQTVTINTAAAGGNAALLAGLH